MFEIVDSQATGPIIKVIGVGGAGGNAINHMIEQGIEALAPHTDSLIVILNDKLEEVLGEDVTQEDAFRAADDVLNNAVAGIAEIINLPGLVNVDFQDVKTVMSEQGMAMMGSAS